MMYCFQIRFKSVVASLLMSGIFASQAMAQSFDSCVNGLRQTAMNQGISQNTFDKAFKGIEPDPEVLKSFDYQPEFRIPIWDYVAGLVDDERVADGRAMMKQWSKILDQAEQQYGVDKNVIVAVWGVESNFGRIQGKRELIRSLATLVCANKRQTFFRGELMATLKILQSGDIAQEFLVGSWAGAFGQTQFMPSTYQRLAVDFDGDGRRDIVQSVPDALGSTANYLHRAGWAEGEPWGYEVKLPENYNGPSGRTTKQSLAQWKSLGIKRIEPVNSVMKKQMPDSAQAALILPSGAKGPAFLVFRNFNAIYSYNAAESYALSIAHLSDRIQGGSTFTTAWPTDDAGTSRAERREIQQRLVDRGFDIGDVDGLIGAKTRTAISEFQTSVGLPVDGRAGQRVLRALRTAGSKSTGQ
ncbi:lytic murein transglycosylase [Sheuella amnicola]|nr:lytic murein transglycosylase [Sheuella amnicola]